MEYYLSETDGPSFPSIEEAMAYRQANPRLPLWRRIPLNWTRNDPKLEQRLPTIIMARPAKVELCSICGQCTDEQFLDEFSAGTPKLVPMHEGCLLDEYWLITKYGAGVMSGRRRVIELIDRSDAAQHSWGLLYREIADYRIKSDRFSDRKIQPAEEQAEFDRWRLSLLARVQEFFATDWEILNYLDRSQIVQEEWLEFLSHPYSSEWLRNVLLNGGLQNPQAGSQGTGADA